MSAKKPRGFAAMSPERRRAIAAKGGKGVPAHLRSFSKDVELARRAGQKGGRNIPKEKRTFSSNTELAKRAGRTGGAAFHKNRPVRIKPLE
jgi:general stress protein YciG